MKNKIIYGLFVFVITTLISYYLLTSLIFSTFLGISNVLIYISISMAKSKNDRLFHNIEASYNFTNLLNISMFESKSIFQAYKSVEEFVDEDFVDIEPSSFIESLVTIANEYNLKSFLIYINTLVMYDNNGGNFNEMIEVPSSLCLKTKIYYNKLYLSKKSKVIDIAFLYMLWILIMILLKITIADYYESMISTSSYKIIVTFILLFGFYMLGNTIRNLYKNKIKGL